MDFTLTKEHEMLKDTVRKFGEKEILPLVEEYSEREEHPEIIFQKIAKLGLLGLMISEEYGGSGPDCMGTSIVAEELSRVDGGIAGTILHHMTLGMIPIFNMGTEEQKQKYLVPGVRGEIKCCFALTEPDAGSDVGGIKTVARRNRDHYVINGAKAFITNGGISNVYCVACKTSPEKRVKGISVILVDRGTPGFGIGKKIKKIGWRTSEATELFFQDCLIPCTNLLGEEDRGFINLMKTLHVSRIVWAFLCIGTAQGAFEAALQYAKDREAFGQPIGKFQSIAFMLADMATEIDVARWYSYRAASMWEHGEECAKEAHMAKLYASQVADHVTSSALHIHGGYGFCREYPVSRFFCDARLSQIGEGTTEIMRRVISRHIGL
jgi:butyryl-CoA dehydrogenase